MKKAQLALALGVGLALASASVVAAQTAQAPTQADVDKLVELLRKDVRAGKADILGKTMALDATQSAAFWPVYKQYEAERQAIGDKQLALQRKYKDEFLKVLPAKVVARFFQVESRLNNLIDLKVSSQIPLIY